MHTSSYANQIFNVIATSASDGVPPDLLYINLVAPDLLYIH